MLIVDALKISDIIISLSDDDCDLVIRKTNEDEDDHYVCNGHGYILEGLVDHLSYRKNWTPVFLNNNYVGELYK